MRKMKTTGIHRVCSALLSCAVMATAMAPLAFAATNAVNTGLDVSGVNTGNGIMQKIAGYDTGYFNVDGGIAEIIAYNTDNDCFYVVNGDHKNVDIVSLAGLNKDGNADALTVTKRVQIDEVLNANMAGYVIGDITSISLDTHNKQIAVAVQADAYDAQGLAVVLDYDGNFKASYTVGVQPDMIKFSPDGKYLLTADEAEPRNGYGAGAVDPKGSVSIINIETNAVTIADFTAFDAQRDALVANNVIVKKGMNPSADFEPEYITMTKENPGVAYVSLQEANAIATVDVVNGTIIAVESLGFKDHMAAGNELDANKKDDLAVLKNEPLLGVYMPDGISSYVIGGTTYILAANEGDGSEWGEEDTDGYYNNEDDVKLYYPKEGECKDAKIDILNPDMVDGLPALPTLETPYGAFENENAEENFEGYTEYQGHSFGARSFSIYSVDGAGKLTQVFDSGSDMEQITAKLASEGKLIFNNDNDENGIDKRSDNKGPEPENITVMTVAGKTYAYIGLERVSGMMVYDITNPAAATFVDYINTRVYSTEEDVSKAQGDIAAEGICAIDAVDSPTGYPLVLTANEVSGTVAVYQHRDENAYVAPVVPTATPEPTPEATATPTATPETTAVPTATVVPTATPVVTATAVPTANPTAKPTAVPTAAPTATVAPTATPIVTATAAPTANPTAKPTAVPTAAPTAAPTATPVVTVAPAAVPVTGTGSPVTGENVLVHGILLFAVAAAAGTGVVMYEKRKHNQSSNR